MKKLAQIIILILLIFSNVGAEKRDNELNNLFTQLKNSENTKAIEIENKIFYPVHFQRILQNCCDKENKLSNISPIYILENNGVYGLTKGQYSATADVGSKKKKGTTNETQPIDLCALAVNLGCTFVARSFSGAKHLAGISRSSRPVIQTTTM